jgi:hypothetical protein
MRDFSKLTRWIGLALLAAVVYYELSRPPEERTWHGRLGGLVPYDFRPPTLSRIRDAFWNPEADYLFTDRVFGLGWGINIPVLIRRLRVLAEQA